MSASELPFQKSSRFPSIHNTQQMVTPPAPNNDTIKMMPSYQSLLRDCSNTDDDINKWLLALLMAKLLSSTTQPIPSADRKTMERSTKQKARLLSDLETRYLKTL